MITNKSSLQQFIIGVVMVLILVACAPQPTTPDNDLQITIDAQQSEIAVLETQIAEQIDINQSQWEAISHLSTQMPRPLDVDEPGVAEITPTPTPWRDIEYPPTTRTGIDDVDRVIEAVLSQEAGAKLELVRFTTAACTTADGLGGPPKCESEEDDGTLVQVFPVLGGEGIHIRPETIENVFDFTVRGLLAVYRVPENAVTGEGWPAGEYGLVFTSEDNNHPHTITLLIEEGFIVRLDFSPIWPPSEAIMQKSNEFILPPSTP